MHTQAFFALLIELTLGHLRYSIWEPRKSPGPDTFTSYTGFESGPILACQSLHGLRLLKFEELR